METLLVKIFCYGTGRQPARLVAVTDRDGERVGDASSLSDHRAGGSAPIARNLRLSLLRHRWRPDQFAPSGPWATPWMQKSLPSIVRLVFHAPERGMESQTIFADITRGLVVSAGPPQSSSVSRRTASQAVLLLTQSATSTRQRALNAAIFVGV
jgi:hypothetical protein